MLHGADNLSSSIESSRCAAGPILRQRASRSDSGIRAHQIEAQRSFAGR